MISLEGTYSFAWPLDTSAAENPPDPTDIVRVFESLGYAAAVAQLGARAEVEGAAALESRVYDFAARLEPPAVETGAPLGAFVTLGGRAVAGGASKVWAKLAAEPALVTRLGTLAVVGALGATWLSSEEQSEKAAIDSHAAALASQLERLSPQDAAKLLVSSAPWSGGSGPSLGTVAAVGAVVVVGLLAWRWLR